MGGVAIVIPGPSKSELAKLPPSIPKEVMKVLRGKWAWAWVKEEKEEEEAEDEGDEEEEDGVQKKLEREIMEMRGQFFFWNKNSERKEMEILKNFTTSSKAFLDATDKLPLHLWGAVCNDLEWMRINAAKQSQSELIQKTLTDIPEFVNSMKALIRLTERKCEWRIGIISAFLPPHRHPIDFALYTYCISLAKLFEEGTKNGTEWENPDLVNPDMVDEMKDFPTFHREQVLKFVHKVLKIDNLKLPSNRPFLEAMKTVPVDLGAADSRHFPNKSRNKTKKPRMKT